MVGSCACGKPAAWQRQKGLASVELALVTPFLLIMLLVSAEFTRVFYEFNTLTKGVRDAARLLAEDAYDGTNQFEMPIAKVTSARNLAVYGNINGTGSPLLSGLSTADIAVAQVNLGSAPAVREHIEVTANYTFQPLAPVISGMGFLPNDIGMAFVLTASSSMRAL